MPNDVTQGQFKFLKGAEDVIAPAEGKRFDWNSAADIVRGQLSEAMGSRHVAFLMGAGCPSFVVNDKQLGIDPMGPLAKEFTGTIGRRGNKFYANATERKILKDSLGLDMNAPEFLNFEGPSLRRSDQFVSRQAHCGIPALRGGSPWICRSTQGA
jgi:hypothetical protein